MKILMWDDQDVLLKRDGGFYPAIPPSVDPKDLESLVKFMQRSNISLSVRFCGHGSICNADVLKIEAMLYGMSGQEMLLREAVLIYVIGVHIVLFVLCCYVLLARQKRVQWFVLGCAFVMFVVSTADIAYTIRCSTTDLPDLIHPMDLHKVQGRIRPKPALYVTNK